MSQQTAYNHGRSSQESDVDRAIHDAMRLYGVHDLGLSSATATNRADEELQRRIPRSVITELASMGMDVAHLDVLDLGAGLGGMSEELVIRGARVTALEPGVAWADITKRRVERHGRDFRLVQAFGESIPLPAASVDLVVSLQVLEHVKDPGKVLAEVWRVLRPGGHFYLACENYLAFYEPHYRVPWLPLLPKSFGALYLRLIGRSPKFLDEAVTYITYLGVLRTCRRLGFIRRRDEQMIASLRTRRGGKWAVLRAMAQLTGEAGPLWLNRYQYAFKIGIYETFQKPPSAPPCATSP
jgi:SAM-dependent methyltransferase